MKKMKKLLLLSVVAMLFSCSKEADFTKIKVGMKSSEVIALVGEPKTKTETGIAGTWWSYDTHLVVIQNDTVNEFDTNENVKKRMEEVTKGLDDLNETVKDMQ